MTTGADGKATTSLKSATAGAPNVTATAEGVNATCSVTVTAVTVTRAIQLTANPTTLAADGQSTSIVTATVTDNGRAAADGTAVTFTTNWGTLQGGQGTPPQTLQATTTNGQATATLVADNIMPTGDGTFTLSATSGSASASLMAQAQQAPANAGPMAKLVLYWLAPPGDGGCKEDGATVSGGVVAHLFVVCDQGTQVVTGNNMDPTMFAHEVANHPGQNRQWRYSTDPAMKDRLAMQTYTDPTKPLPPCAPGFQQGQTLYDIQMAPCWSTDGWGCHNGAWRLDAEYWYVKNMAGMPPNPPPQPTKGGAGMGFTLNNLLVTVMEDADHPPLLKWYGAGSANNKTEVKFTLTCEGSVDISPVVRIYDLRRWAAPGDSSAIRTLTLPPQTVTSAGTVFTTTWDGMGDGQAQQVPPQAVPSGVYAFTVDTSWLGPTLGGPTYGGWDGKTSRWLSLYLPTTNNQPESGVKYLGIDTASGQRKFEVAYVLKDTDGLAASAGHIDLYKPDLTSTPLKTLSGSDLTASATGDVHRVTVNVNPSDLFPPGNYQFAVFAMDSANGAPLREKAHRQKRALETGGTFCVPLQINVISPYGGRHIQYDPNSLDTDTAHPHITFDLILSPFGGPIAYTVKIYSVINSSLDSPLKTYHVDGANVGRQVVTWDAIWASGSFPPKGIYDYDIIAEPRVGCGNHRLSYRTHVTGVSAAYYTGDPNTANTYTTDQNGKKHLDKRKVLLSHQVADASNAPPEFLNLLSYDFNDFSNRDVGLTELIAALGSHNGYQGLIDIKGLGGCYFLFRGQDVEGRPILENAMIVWPGASNYQNMFFWKWTWPDWLGQAAAVATKYQANLSDGTHYDVSPPMYNPPALNAYNALGTDAVVSILGHRTVTIGEYMGSHELNLDASDRPVDDTWSVRSDSTEFSFDQVRLVAYFGCFTAKDFGASNYLLVHTVDRGADCAIGFVDEIIGDGPLVWTYHSTLWQDLNSGMTIDDAHFDALVSCILDGGIPYGYSSYVRWGANVTIVPARFGN